ncbi:uncharacterized protein G6M90_00g104820 [Metarhizium brunneum]|uniref:Uncharacterized protein n=1 Tax=Metarhizium brunneum TaxID=500148 RepID=A0A7D5Z426_9HYPO|nr:hypothetical protein G6M90_00g104820 [Metarhizium brunneum]
MLTAVLGVMSAATGAWLVSYIIDVAELLPDEDGDMLREAIPTAHQNLDWPGPDADRESSFMGFTTILEASERER